MRETLRTDPRMVLLALLSAVSIMGTPACSGCDDDSGSSTVIENDAGGEDDATPTTEADTGTEGGDGTGHVADTGGVEPDAAEQDTGNSDGAWRPPTGIQSSAAIEVESEGYSARIFFGPLGAVGQAESPRYLLQMGPGSAYVPPEALFSESESP